MLPRRVFAILFQAVEPAYVLRMLSGRVDVFEVEIFYHVGNNIFEYFMPDAIDRFVVSVQYGCALKIIRVIAEECADRHTGESVQDIMVSSVLQMLDVIVDDRVTNGVIVLIKLPFTRGYDGRQFAKSKKHSMKTFLFFKAACR